MTLNQFLNPETIIEHLLEVTPSKLLAHYYLGKMEEIPPDWWKLSLIENLEWNGNLSLKHPISAEDKPLKAVKELVEHKHFSKILTNLREEEKHIIEEIKQEPDRFLEIWNGLPKLLENRYKSVLKEYFLSEKSNEIAKELIHLPADFAMPDHTWLNRAEIYATLIAIERTKSINNKNLKPYLLRLKISPVQGFIANAKKELDLWAGSHILSILTFEAIKVIIEETTWPGGVIFPHLRDQPFFRALFSNIDGELKEKLRIPNMPNKVLAIVGLEDMDNVGKIKEKIQKRVGDLLVEVFGNAWDYYYMGESFEKLSEYEKLLRDYFSITLEALPYGKIPVYDRHAKKIINATHGDREAYYPYLFAVLDQKTDFKSRMFEKFNIEPGFRCTVCGELPAIGYKDLNGKVRRYGELKTLWDGHSEELHKRKMYAIRKGERLCPMCLVKRFYPWYFAKKYTIEEPKHWVRSVSEVAFAMTEWKKIYEAAKRGKRHPIGEELVECLGKLFQAVDSNAEVVYAESWKSLKALAKIYGSDEEEFRKKLIDVGISPDEFVTSVRSKLEKVYKRINEPPKYYAILQMDGDNMGKVISGKRGIRDVEAYMNAEPTVRGIRRPVTPTVHQAITRSLSRFAVEKVPKIVKKYGGEPILAGGDDVLALSPTKAVYDMAYEIQETFRMNWDSSDNFTPLQGNTRSMSAGILIVHYKHPLYDALDRVKQLEHKAKESGRNGVAIGYLAHSGMYREVIINWEGLKQGKELAKFFTKHPSEDVKSGKISSRIIYELIEGTELWPNDPNAVVELLKYEILRHSRAPGKTPEEKRAWIEERVAQVLNVARHVRPKSLLENKELRELISIDPEKDNAYESWTNYVGYLKGKFGTETAGEVLKEQVKGSFVLIKILIDSGVIG